MIRQDYNLLPPKIKSSYADVELISETPLYSLYEGKSRSALHPIHTIRAFDFTKFEKKDRDSALQLLIKELLHLVAIDPKSILINTFEISDEGQKMAFATIPYYPINYIERKDKPEPSERVKFNDLKSVKDMISDVLLDVEFLSKELAIQDVSSILAPKSIYRFKESGACFVGDWLTAIQIEPQPTMLTGTTFIRSSGSGRSKEMVAFVLTILELNGVDSRTISKLKKMDPINDELFDLVLKGVIAQTNLGSMTEELRKEVNFWIESNPEERSTPDKFIQQDSPRRKQTLTEKKSSGSAVASTIEHSTVKEIDFLFNKVIGKKADATDRNNLLWDFNSVTGLTSLDLKENNIDLAGVKALCLCTSWKYLATLGLGFNHIGAKGARELSQHNIWTELVSLDLACNDIGAIGAAALSQSSSWKHLATLDLRENNIGAEGAMALSQNESWAKLTTLYLYRNGIGAKGAISLGQNKSWRALATLDLGNNNIGAEGVTGLSKNNSWTELKSMSLYRNNISAEGVAGLSKNSSWGKLKTLNLHSNRVSIEGAAAALKNRWPDIKIDQQ